MIGTAVVVGAMVIAAVGLSRSDSGSGHTVQAMTTSTASVVFAGSNGLTFTPEPDQAAQAPMDAESAYEHMVGHAIENPAIEYEYGTLTKPVSPLSITPIQYQYKDLPIWAYWSLGPCPVPEYPVTPSSPATSSPSSCLQWIFADASTGSQVLTNWQPVSDDSASPQPSGTNS